MNRLENLKKILESSLEKEITKKNITVYGYQYNYQVPFIKSVSPYWFAENVVEEFIAPYNKDSNNNNRPGTIKESTEYITIHDTASAAVTADEYAHAKYVSNGGGGTSWHYSVGSKMACHQIPDNEVAYHAGDGTNDPFTLLPTGVFGNVLNPTIDFKDGFYVINKEITQVKAPLTDQGEITSKAHLNDAGLRIELINGEYYIGKTYFNKTYQKIANRGGNLNSIGIETMVNEGSSLIRTWHRTAKLVAHLLIENNLSVERVKPHHYFSGKDCPMTLRRNHLYDYFMEMVKLEYEILKNFSDIKIKLVSKDEALNQEGIIIGDNFTKTINYQIILEDEKDQLITDYTVLVKL